MIVLIHCVLRDANSHPALCTLFKACILNETDTLLWLPYLIYDGSSTITESEKYSTEIIMIH